MCGLVCQPWFKLREFEMAYRVFVRNWWKHNAAYPNGLEPNGGARKTTLVKRVETETQARSICQTYNATHEPGPLSRKAEYEEH